MSPLTLSMTRMCWVHPLERFGTVGFKGSTVIDICFKKEGRGKQINDDGGRYREWEAGGSK